VTTKQIKWGRNLVVGQKQFLVPGVTVGYYIWHPTIIMQREEKRIYANNFIIFDLDIARQEQRNSTPLVNEALFYHELLHPAHSRRSEEKALAEEGLQADFDMGQVIHGKIYKYWRDDAEGRY